MIGECGLCRQQAELRHSHFLPRAVFRMAREPASPNPNPVVVTARRAANSSRQIHDPFLCAGCEDRFSRGGESHVLREVVRSSGDFRLRDRVRRAPEVGRGTNWVAHDVRSARIQLEQYLYFAASLLWRAAVRDWDFEGQRLARIPLGVTYREQFREYLLGDAPFPARARLFVHVWTDDPIHFTTIAPSASRPQGTWRYKFCVPGVTFTCFVGGAAVQEQDAGALNSRGVPCMWLCRFQDDPLFRGFAELARNPESLAGSTPPNNEYLHPTRSALARRRGPRR